MESLQKDNSVIVASGTFFKACLHLALGCGLLRLAVWFVTGDFAFLLEKMK